MLTWALILILNETHVCLQARSLWLCRKELNRYNVILSLKDFPW